ncbi:phage portal protein [Clostridium porci]|uniref:phage portal protein n=1 Tax=Clostridium porci TaxID=2605778 RepID=UPI003A919AF1
MGYIKEARDIYTYTMSRDEWDELNPDKRTIRTLIIKHQKEVRRLKKLKQYYEGQHKILGEKRKTKLVCNHAKDISDTASSYFIGNPVSYKSQQDIKPLMVAFEIAGADEADGDNGLDLSIYGRCYEYVYPEEGGTDLTIKTLEPENTFVVYDDTIEQRELFAVYYYAKKDDSDKRQTVYVATVLTRKYKHVLNILDIDDLQTLVEAPEPHYFDEVPIIEYRNNKLAIGDFELQIPLIDAYNALMSDRITDKEQFIDSILALYGALLGDEDTKDADGKTAAQRLKDDKLLELPKDAKAEYLTRTFDETGVEILKKAVEQDIHKFSHIPCMTDESFGGNVSGVAMEFKLLGMENITKIKTRYYKKGLRKRMRLFSGWLNKSRAINIDISGITPVFTRALPKNLLEISQIVANLWGKVSKKTLLSQVPFVNDVEAELSAVEKEAEEALKQQQAMFGIGSNIPLPDEGKEPVEEKKTGDVNEW